MVRRRQFSYHSTSRVIKEVKKHPCIWDKEHEHFNDIYKVGLAWKTIAWRLQLTEEAVKMKWKNLRDTLNREIKKNPSSLTNYTGNWAFFREMLFTIKPKNQESETDVEVEYLQIYDEENITELELQDEKPDDYYDLFFLESLAPYFKVLDPIRKIAIRSKIQDMLVNEISIQNSEVESQGKRDLVYINTVEKSDITDLDFL